MNKIKQFLILAVTLLVITNIIKYTNNEFNFVSNKSVERLLQDTTAQPAKKIKNIKITNEGDQNKSVVDACDAAGNPSSTDSDREEKGQSALDEYKSLYGDPITASLFKTRSLPDIPTLVPRLVIPAIGFLFFIFTLLCLPYYCCYCCCETSCPYYECCKRDPIQKPFSKGEMCCPLITVVIFGLLTFSTSIPGIVFSKGINQGYKEVKCSLLKTLGDFQITSVITYTDDTQDTFLGITGLFGKLSAIDEKFDTFTQKLIKFADDPSSNTINDIDNKNAALLDSLQKSLQDDPDMKIYKDNNNYASVFFSDDVYPKFITALKEVSSGTSKGLKTAISAAKDKAKDVSNQSVSIGSSITDASSQIKKLETTLNDNIKKFSDMFKPADNPFSQIDTAVMAIYAVYLSISILGLLLTVIGYFTKGWKIRYVLNFLWIILAIITALGFLITFILGLVSIILLDSCNFLNSVLNDPNATTFKDLSLDAEIRDKAIACKSSLGGKGHLLKSFNVDQQIGQINDATKLVKDSTKDFKIENFNAVSKWYDGFNNQHLKLKEQGYFKPVDLSNLAAYTESAGKFDSTEANISLEQLNQAFTGSTFSCINTPSAAQEKVVFLQNECGSYTKLITSMAQFNTAYAPQSCIILEELLNEAKGTDLNTLNYNTRYPGCNTGNVSALYKKLWDQVNVSKKKFKDSQVGGKARTDITAEIYTNQGNYVTEFQKLINFINDEIIKELEEMAGLISNILTGTNCLFFGENIQNVFEGLCYTLVYNIYVNYKLLWIINVSNFFLWFFLFKMSIRFVGKEKEESVKQLNQQVYPSGDNQEMAKF